jgi:hypothetical protein
MLEAFILKCRSLIYSKVTYLDWERKELQAAADEAKANRVEAEKVR